MSKTNYLSKQEVAEILGISKKSGTIYNLEKSGKITGKILPRKTGLGRKRSMLYSEDSVMELLKDIEKEQEIAPDAGNYIAGLIDGEGTFCILCRRVPATRTRRDGSNREYIQNRAYLKIALRDDDLPLLIWIRKTLGFGMLRMNKIPKNHPENAKPSACFQVGRHRDTVKLIELLDKYILHGKKLRDYLIWKEFVLERSRPEWSQDKLDQLVKNIGKIRGYVPPRKSDIDSIAVLNKELEEKISGHGIGKKYK